jgi:hypothetical protein
MDVGWRRQADKIFTRISFSNCMVPERRVIIKDDWSADTGQTLRKEPRTIFIYLFIVD